MLSFYASKLFYVCKIIIVHTNCIHSTSLRQAKVVAAPVQPMNHRGHSYSTTNILISYNMNITMITIPLNIWKTWKTLTTQSLCLGNSKNIQFSVVSGVFQGFSGFEFKLNWTPFALGLESVNFRSKRNQWEKWVLELLHIIHYYSF